MPATPVAPEAYASIVPPVVQERYGAPEESAAPPPTAMPAAPVAPEGYASIVPAVVQERYGAAEPPVAAASPAAPEAWHPQVTGQAMMAPPGDSNMMAAAPPTVSPQTGPDQWPQAQPPPFDPQLAIAAQPQTVGRRGRPMFIVVGIVLLLGGLAAIGFGLRGGSSPQQTGATGAPSASSVAPPTFGSPPPGGPGP